MRSVVEPVIKEVGPWLPTPGPFSETEFEDLNNFHHMFVPQGKDPQPGQPSYARFVLSRLPGRIDKLNRDQLDDRSNFSERYLDQTPGQFLSTVEDTAAEIGGSFQAVQATCCKWAKDNRLIANLELVASEEVWEEVRARRDQWESVRNSIYRALRERGYAIRELIQ